MDDTKVCSIILSKKLDMLELSEDHVRAKVSKFSRLEVLANAVDFQPDYQNTILTGSIMDGVGWKGYMTDIDTMLRFSYVTVLEPDRNTVTCKDNHHIFELGNKDSHAGYTRLKLLKEGPPMENNIFSLTPNGAKSYCYEMDGNFYLSSFKFKTAFNRYQVIPERPAWVVQSSYNYAVTFPDEEEILEHGPSLCFSDETKEEPLHDSVPCFHCDEWPGQASEWKTRTPRNWPTKKDVDNVVAKGCEVVPVGFIGSKTRHIEWRLSFALAEKQLLRTFNNTQHKCYALLKMLLKERVEEVVPGVLSSFQMKNALFWTMEKTDRKLWCEDSLTEVFLASVDTMYNFIKEGNAPGYFIPANNVLDRRMNDAQREKLRDLFGVFKKEGWKCLLQCESLNSEPSLQDLVNQVSNAPDKDGVLKTLGEADTKDIWFQHDIGLFPRYEDARLEIMTSFVPQTGTLTETIIGHHMMLKQLHDRSVNEFYRNTLKPIVASVKSSLGNNLYALHLESVDTTSTGASQILTAAEEYLKDGMKSDAASGKLKYASYQYMMGNEQECKEIAESVLRDDHHLSVYVPHFLPCKFGTSQKEIENYSSFVRKTDMPLDDRFLSSLYQAVLFLPSEINASPPAVQFQLRTPLPEPLKYTYWLGWAIYDPFVFAHYLVFLCEVKAGRLAEAESVLSSIECLLCDNEVGYEVSALNLLGYSYVSINRVEKGVPFLLMAMEKAIVPNCSVWQMGHAISEMLRGPFTKAPSKFSNGKLLNI